MNQLLYVKIAIGQNYKIITMLLLFLLATFFFVFSDYKLEWIEFESIYFVYVLGSIKYISPLIWYVRVRIYYMLPSSIYLYQIYVSVYYTFFSNEQYTKLFYWQHTTLIEFMLYFAWIAVAIVAAIDIFRCFKPRY